eukprot:jgi/Botrbrau1/15956/Bobra.0340s0004.1
MGKLVVLDTEPVSHQNPSWFIPNGEVVEVHLDWSKTAPTQDTPAHPWTQKVGDPHWGRLSSHTRNSCAGIGMESQARRICQLSHSSRRSSCTTACISNTASNIIYSTLCEDRPLDHFWGGGGPGGGTYRLYTG